MKARSLISAGALALALAGMAAADVAAAADRPERGERAQRGGWSHRSEGNRAESRGDTYRRSPQVRPIEARRTEPRPESRPEPRPEYRRSNDWRNAQRQNVDTSAVQARNWGEARARIADQDQQNRAPPKVKADGRSSWDRGRDRADGGTWRDRDQRSDSWRDNNRDRARDADRRNESWRDNDRGRDGQRWSGSRNDGWRNDRDRRDWDRNGWRRDNRYDWRHYRDRNRTVFRIGRYYTPYYGYSYRRVGIGFFLGSLFYGSRYWIDDPWMYRLPPVFGPYRWVRYYDDVLLVNTYTGEVVDVIYDFFW